MKNKTRIFGLLLLCISIVFACEPEGSDVLLGKGTNYVRLVESANELNILGVDLKPGEVKPELINILRDVNSQDELNTTATVTIKANDKLVADYNAAHKTTFEPLPTSLYKFSETSVNMASGDFAKIVNLVFDPTKLDPTKSYALGVSIDNGGKYKMRNGQSDALFQIIAKNKYHARYKATGVFTHPTAGPRDIDRIKDLITVNENTVSAELGDLGGAGYFMLLTVNADNSVTITKSGVTPNIDQSYSKNYYDPATQSFHLHYSYNVAAPRIVKEVIKRQ
jgi:hypothetical protein